MSRNADGTDNRLADLLLVWEESTRAGHPISVSELCRDCPDLVPELEHEIGRLAALDRFMFPHARQTADPFVGTSRFEVLRELGRGGMGRVYAVHDGQRGNIVALKTLHESDAQSMWRLKREFRVLADLVHPNLVTLYELFAEEPPHFFTMELIEGVYFLTFVRGGSVSARRQRLSDPALDSPPHQALQDSAASQPPAPLATGDQFRRLLAVLRQLAKGLTALHQAGKLHCDIKPSNVLVTGAERLVLLDFGLATEAMGTCRPRPHRGNIGGTFALHRPRSNRR